MNQYTESIAEAFHNAYSAHMQKIGLPNTPWDKATGRVKDAALYTVDNLLNNGIIMGPSDAIYVSIGNTDNRLTQEIWADFTRDVFRALSFYTMEMYGVWHSLPDAQFQTACWMFPCRTDKEAGIAEAVVKTGLAKLAAKYDQAGIAWANANTAFIEPNVHADIDEE